MLLSTSAKPLNGIKIRWSSAPQHWRADEERHRKGSACTTSDSRCHTADPCSKCDAHRQLHPERRILRTRPVKPVESGSPLAAAVAAAALDWARFAQAGRLRTLKLPGRLLKLDSDGVTEPAHVQTGISLARSGDRKCGIVPPKCQHCKVYSRSAESG